MTALSRRNFITAAAATAVAATATPAVATEVSPVACDALEPAEWMNACYYMGGDICRHGGKRWFALRNHTSGDFFTLRNWIEIVAAERFGTSTPWKERFGT